MFMLYKDLKILYWIAILLIGVPGGIYGAWKENLVLILIAVLVVPFVSVVILSIIGNNRFNNLNKIRETNCNIAEFYNGLTELLSKCKNPKKLNPQILNAFNLNIAVAFIDMGRYQDALNILMGIAPQSFGKGFTGAQGRAVLFNNLAFAYIGLGDLESAEKLLVEMKKAIDDPKLKNMDKIKNQLFDLYTGKKMLIQIEKGNFEGAEQIFLMLLEKADNNMHQVYVSYNLARIYLNGGNTEKAKRYVDFVMQYGGDTVYKTELAKLLIL